MLMISSAAMAAPDSQQVGPYSVSFSLDANYQPQIAQPMEAEDTNAYSIRLFVDNSTFAVIDIIEYPQLTDSTIEMHKNMMAMSMWMYEGLNATDIEDRVIDGKDGIVIKSEPVEAVAGAPSEVFKALYWLDSENCECGPVSVGTTRVIVTSLYPQDVTEALLSSLSVVKGEASTAAPDDGGQVLPPE